MTVTERTGDWGDGRSVSKRSSSSLEVGSFWERLCTIVIFVGGKGWKPRTFPWEPTANMPERGNFLNCSGFERVSGSAQLMGEETNLLILETKQI
jgi:hypothetical protein